MDDSDPGSQGGSWLVSEHGLLESQKMEPLSGVSTAASGSKRHRGWMRSNRFKQGTRFMREASLAEGSLAEGCASATVPE